MIHPNPHAARGGNRVRHEGAAWRVLQEEDIRAAGDGRHLVRDIDGGPRATRAVFPLHREGHYTRLDRFRFCLTTLHVQMSGSTR